MHKVLIVEDEELCEKICLCLNGRKSLYSVGEAVNGQDGLEKSVDSSLILSL